MKRLLIAALIAAIGFAAPAFAVMPDEVLEDPALEARAREISKDLRCLVCQNQSIDDSNADLAHDLRVLVRERLVAGDSNDEVREFVVQRYGDYVLLTPPLNTATILLWAGPALILLGGIAVAVFSFRRIGRTLPVEGVVDAEDEKRIAELLGEDGDEKDAPR